MAVKHSHEVEAKPVAAGKDTTIQVLTSSQEGPNFALRKFSMRKGGGMPRHTNTVEHEQYVLRGQARIGIDGKTFDVKQGDVVFIPEGAVHYYENMGEEPFEFLCIIPNKEDKITIVDEASCQGDREHADDTDGTDSRRILGGMPRIAVRRRGSPSACYARRFCRWFEAYFFWRLSSHFFKDL